MNYFSVMRNVIYLLLGTALSIGPVLALTTEMVAEPGVTNNQPYRVIVDRNPFGLKPPPPPPAEAPPPPPPKVELYLTGISTLFKPKRAYLMAKDLKKDNPYYSLAENEGRDGVEVLEIDEVNRKVKIKNQGNEVVLTFENNGVPPPAPLPAGAMPLPGIPGVPVVGMHPGLNGGQPQPLPAVQAFQQPNAIMQPGFNPAQPVNAPLGRSIPSRNVRMPINDPYPVAPGAAQNGYGAAPQPREPEVDPATQYLILKAQEENNARLGVPGPPIPPP